MNGRGAFGVEVDPSMKARILPRFTLGLALAGAAACDKPAGLQTASSSSPFRIVFQTYDGAMDEKTEFRAKLRVKTSDGQTFEYKTPVSHRDCYLLAGSTSDPSVAMVEGDAAHLVCSGGGQSDEATVVRKSDTSLEIVFFQMAFTGPGSSSAEPEHKQTFTMAVPKAARIRTTFEPLNAK